MSAASVPVGVNVPVRVAGSYATVPAAAPPGPVSVMLTVAACTGSSKDTVTGVVRDTLELPASGAPGVATGGIVSGGATVSKIGSTQ